MPFLNLDSNWSNLAPLYNQNFNSKPSIPKKINQFNSFDDGFIRGGLINATLASVKDVGRIGKAIIQNLIFLPKQAGLQLTNPRLEWDQSKAPPFLGGPNRQFTGAGILESTGGTAFGLHFDRAGLLGMIKDDQKYGGGVDSTSSGITWQNNFGSGKESNKKINDRSYNRLVRYLGKINFRQQPRLAQEGFSLPPGIEGPQQPAIGYIDNNKSDSIILDKYFGGPNSVYGIGYTTINSYKDRTTIRLSDLGTKASPGILRVAPETREVTPSSTTTNRTNIARSVTTSIDPATGRRSRTVNPGGTLDVTITTPSVMERTPELPGVPSIPRIGSTNPDLVLKLNGFTPLLNTEIIETLSTTNPNLINTSLSNQLLNSPLISNISIAGEDIESRIGVSHGGALRKVDSINSINITDSKTFYETLKGKSSYDAAISSSTIFDSTSPSLVDGKFGNDIIKFRIEFLNNDTPVVDSVINTDVLAFRAYIDEFNDGMDARWNAYRYMGRGEEFYVYDGFTRDISTTFTIFAHTKEEMRPIYRKLNYLMSTFTPDYKFNKMRGNIGYLTIGDYLYRQPGVFTSIRLNNMLDTHWEINLDGDQHEVPKYFKVALTFKPIHTFLPRKAKYGSATDGSTWNSPFITPDKVAYKEKNNRYLD